MIKRSPVMFDVLMDSNCIWLTMTVLLSSVLAFGEPIIKGRHVTNTHSLSNSPTFDVYKYENYTVQQGSSAFLPCTVKNLGNETVSWIRGRDSHILSVAEDVFISDPRISTTLQDGETWTLQIKSVTKDDDGVYECQISTVPKLSHFVHLIVRVPKVRILGDQDIFVKSSSSVHLKCVVSMALEPPLFIEWMHNGERLNSIVAPSKRIQISPPELLAEGTSMGTLTIWRAMSKDSGSYTCWPAQMENATVTLHVVDNNPAELQTGGSYRMAPLNTLVSLFVSLILLNQTESLTTV